MEADNAGSNPAPAHYIPKGCGKMKVISLLQPWATLWALGKDKGAKGNETRPKRCAFKNYRGKALIHASKGFSKFQRQLCETEPFKSVLAENGFNSPDDLVLGAIIGSCDITDCQEITEENIPPSTEKESAFGDYTLGLGRLMFTSTNNVLFSKPIPAKGQLGLWEFDMSEHIQCKS